MRKLSPTLIWIFWVLFFFSGTQPLIADQPKVIHGSARSLAMGDATVGNPHKADAFFINPAGLTRVDRGQILFHVSDPFAYDFVSYAHPVVNAFRLAAGGSQLDYHGIQERTYGLAVGRAISERFAIGAEAHYITWDSLESSEKAGFGINFGALFKPDIIGQPDFGLVLANIPKSEPDAPLPPRVSTSKLEYGLSLPLLNKRLTISAGHELREEESPRVHVGGELNLATGAIGFFPSMALRAGLNHDEITFGSGFETSFVTIDLAYFNDEIQVSAIFEFGRSLHDRVNEYLVGGDNLYDAEKYNQALVAYERAREIDPTNPVIRLRIQKTIGMRYQRAGDFYKRGLQQFKQEEYARAIESWQRVLDFEADYPGVKERLADARKLQEEQIEEYFALAQQSLQDNHYLDAQGFVDKLKALDPQHTGVMVFEKELNDKREQAVHDRYQRSLVAYQQKKYEEAIQLAENALELNEDFAPALQLITDIKEQARDQEELEQHRRQISQLLNQARAAAQSADLNLAEQFYHEVLKESRGNKEARDALDRIMQQRRDSVDSLYVLAEEEYEAGNYRSAIRIIRDIKKALPDYHDATRLQIDCHYKLGVKYYTEGKYLASVQEWDEIIKLDPENGQAKEYRDRAQNKYDSLQKSE